MKGLTIRHLAFYFFFIVTTLLSCSGNLTLAKAVAPITIYLSKKTLVHQKENFVRTALVRNIDPNEQPSPYVMTVVHEENVATENDDEVSLVKHANLLVSKQKMMTMELI